jgi:hypothetical protein
MLGEEFRVPSSEFRAADQDPAAKMDNRTETTIIDLFMIFFIGKQPG